MSGQIRTQQEIAQRAFAPSSQVTIEIPRMADIECLMLDLAGTFTYPAGATGSLKTLKGQALIQRVELVGDGKTTICSVPGWALGVASDRVLDPVSGANNSMTTPAANAAGAVSTQLYLDFAQFDGIRPKDSNLRLSGFSYVELRITFGAWADCFTNTASVPTVFALTLFVDANATTELNPAETVPRFVVKRTSQIISAESSNSAFQTNLPVGNVLRSIKFFSHISGVASDGVINKLTARNGIDTRVSGSARAYRNRMRGWRDTQTGFLEIDFARQSRQGVLASNAWAVKSPAQPILELDYTGGAGRVIEVVTTEYVGI
jgi:hypothetical protein